MDEFEERDERHGRGENCDNDTCPSCGYCCGAHHEYCDVRYVFCCGIAYRMFPGESGQCDVCNRWIENRADKTGEGS